MSTSMSKASIDKAGRALASPESDMDNTEHEHIFDEYRKSHLQPLSETTLELQHWLSAYGSRYYIAHRLKRKPQIIRKLRRLSVRLTQLQDIGGCRIIVEKNRDVDKLLAYLENKVTEQQHLEIARVTDYRQRGRDESGYRALHLILSHTGKKLELQIRSRIQHYWAESIERTSVVYGHYLKEQEGHPLVLSYFKTLSDLLFDIESGQEPETKRKLEIAQTRDAAEQIIQESDSRKVFDSYVNEGIIKTLTEKEKRHGRGLNNWIIVFDWNQGSFVSWDIVSRDPEVAIQKYVEHEKIFPAEDGFEVVLVGSSEVATVRETHSHYFGLDSDATVLESLDQSIVGFSQRMDIDIGARQILLCLHRKHVWGKKRMSPDTLKNHHCQHVLTFDSSLETLINKGLVHRESQNGAVSLIIQKKADIEEYL